MQADHVPLLEAINQLTGLERLGLNLPALEDQPLADPPPVIRLDLPELRLLTVDVKVGKVDAQGCPKLFECRRPQAPAVVVAELPVWITNGEVEPTLAEECMHLRFQDKPGPYKGSPEDGILLPTAGYWKYGVWIHGSWMYNGERPGWYWLKYSCYEQAS